MPRKAKGDTPTIEQLAEHLADLADRMVAACAALQREHGAAEPGAKVLQHAEGHVRVVAEVLATDGPAIEAALVAAEPEPTARD
jgi:hypothetical protein